MPNPSVEAAIRLIKAGDRELGRRLLLQEVQRNPSDSVAWLWLSEVVDGTQAKRECLLRCIQIDPQDRLARMGLDLLTDLPVRPESRHPPEPIPDHRAKPPGEGTQQKHPSPHTLFPTPILPTEASPAKKPTPPDPFPGPLPPSAQRKGCSPGVLVVLGVGFIGLIFSMTPWARALDNTLNPPSEDEILSHAIGFADRELATYQPEPFLNPGCEHRPLYYQDSITSRGDSTFTVVGRVVTGNVYCVKDQSTFSATIQYDGYTWGLVGEVEFSNPCVLHDTYDHIPESCTFSQWTPPWKSTPSPG